MIDRAARSRHRYHTKLTKRLNDKKLALERAENAPLSPYAGVREMKIGGAKYRLKLVEEELRQFELSLEEEDRRLNEGVEIFPQSG